MNNGPQGNLVLFNEYICYKLAILLDIPMPLSGICIMDDKTEIADVDIADETNYGYAFFSKYLIKSTNLVSSVIGMIENLEDFKKMLLFDHIIFNSDRNLGNLLVLFSTETTRKIEIIDHTHVFINEAVWDSYCLERAIEENDLCSTKILEDNNALYNMFYRNMIIDEESLKQIGIKFQEKINSDVIRQFIEESPKEWRPTKTNEDALIKYLMYRVDNIGIIISTIMNYINN